ncbi:MAG: AAC(3) family N-acetyltransferase [Abditibacteriota bacterium]|nr:AAC(3) family N-acetyltransferase [Abditibacteriota bacterium]
MITRERLAADLQEMGIDPRGVLLVHSSMKAIGPVEGGADTVLDVFCEYMKEGLLVFPTHTWATINKMHPGPYDYRTEPVCVGILPELFRKRPGVVRSLHPTHSVACLGNGAREFVLGDHLTLTPCDPRGCWGELHRRNAQVLLVGCGAKRNTFLHYVEEANHIPDRLSAEQVTIDIVMPNGSVYKKKNIFHSSSRGDVSQNYDKMVPVFLREGAMRMGLFGEAKCYLGFCGPMAEITARYLRKDPELFSDDSPADK